MHHALSQEGKLYSLAGKRLAHVKYQLDNVSLFADQFSNNKTEIENVIYVCVRTNIIACRLFIFLFLLPFPVSYYWTHL